MQSLKLAGLVIAALTVSPVAQRERLDLSAKQHWELVGSGGATIYVDSPDSGSDLDLDVTFPEKDRFVTMFKKGRFSGLMMERREGDIHTILYDDDGDGLPEMRRIFSVLGPGHMKLIRTERLEWESTESK